MRNLKNSSRHAKELAYKTLVRPILEYATKVWDPHHNVHILKLEMIQRKAARFVLGRFGRPDSVSDMLRELGWDTLDSRRKVDRLVGLHQTYAGKPTWKEMCDRLKSPNFIGKNDHCYKVYIDASKKDVGKYSFLSRTVKEWNELPEVILNPFPRTHKILRQRIEQSGLMIFFS